MQIDRNQLTSLITRLEEEYGKATGGEWQIENDGRSIYHGNAEGGYYIVPIDDMRREDVRPENTTFIADAHNSMPTLLSALKHLMKVAEAGERLVDAVKNSIPVNVSLKIGENETVSKKGAEYAVNLAIGTTRELVNDAVSAYQQAIDTPSN